MHWQQIVKDYFTFSKKDRIGVICLLGLILLFYFLPRLLAKKDDKPFIQQEAIIEKAMDTLQQRAANIPEPTLDHNYPNAYTYEPSVKSFDEKAILFAFDPNTLPPEDWKHLGLNDRTIRTIVNYRSKGGHFYKPEDLQKIWGMPEGFYERVKSYIHITPTYTNSNVSFEKHTDYAAERKARLTIADINTADTSAFIALPGIGSKLALRIVNFRDKLGGFYSVNQIAETYGLPDSTFEKIKPYLQVNAGAVKKININTATKEELKNHPYIRWNIANAIVEYRNQHGNFSSLDELKNIVLIDDNTLAKIAPYLSL